jgi:hypothetical protein
MALEQARNRCERERQDDPIRLREVERPLQRVLGRADVAQRISGHGVEHGCLGDRRWPVKRQGGAFDHRRQDLDRLLGGVLREANDRVGHAHLRRVASALVSPSAARAAAASPVRACA